ncbi:MAG TPA: hypothetical protein DIT25_00895, partial [Candidatus Moranbacteria bacterium]|nr:hypothetical protein [Candidatus Moranbacteria bacterium]
TDDEIYEAGIKNRLELMGSSEYFEEDPLPKRKAVPDNFGRRMPINLDDQEMSGEPEEKILNKELVSGAGINIDVSADKKAKRNSSLDIRLKNIDIQQKGTSDFSDGETEENFNDNNYFENRISKNSRRGKRKESSAVKENFESEKLGNFYHERRVPVAKAKEPDYSKVKLSGGIWRYVSIFGFAATLLILSFAAYLFLPRADIKIFPKTKTHSVDAQIKGDPEQASIDLERAVIPARMISLEDQVTNTIDVTGSKSASNQKARGTITIYNEYSSSPQPLIATTRFQSPDGKIFRLTKTVTVPGTNNVSGEIKPGAIEAEVVADGAGEEYNIEPATFTIPGFKDSGSEKYSKFYAKSFRAMIGGGNDGKTSKAISESDISAGKIKALADLNQLLKDRLKEAAKDGEMILDDAISITGATYAISNSEGEMVENFTIVAKASASAVVFSEADLRRVIGKDIAGAEIGSNQINENDLSLQFGKSDVDFAKNTITIRVNASGKIIPKIDIDNLKRGILGKNEEDFASFLSAYPAIVKAEISYWPFFAGSKIPSYESRVSIELDPALTSH